MKVGVLVTGDVAVRAAHSLSPHPGVTEVVVIGPARSKSFEVVPTADGCDLLLGSGPDAPRLARKHGIALIWDGETLEPGVQVAAASPPGLALALADRESDPRLVAVSHPDLDEGVDHAVRFPEPVGAGRVSDVEYAGRRVALAHSQNRFAACLAVGAKRRVTIVDEGAFLSGVALAAAIAVVDGSPGFAFERSLDYLRAATEMGLVMADDA